MTPDSFPELAQAMQFAIKSQQMYTAAHPRSMDALERLGAILQTWLATQPKVHIAASANKIFLDSQPVENVSLHVKALYKQLNERGIIGFILHEGVLTWEIQALLGLLILKPAKIDDAGGPEAILLGKGVVNIEIAQTRYEEVWEGDGDGDSDSKARGPSEYPRPKTGGDLDDAPDAPPSEMDGMSAPYLLPDAMRIAANWKEALAQAEATRAEREGIVPLHLGHMGATAEGMGVSESFPSQMVVESLRQALQEEEAEDQLSVLDGLPSLPAQPAGLRMAFQAIAPEIFSESTWTMLSGGFPFSEMKLPLIDILATSPQKQALLNALASLLKAKGVDAARIQSMIEQLDWDQLPFESKVRRVLRDKGFYELTPDQTLKFLRELLDKGRNSLFMQVLESMLLGMTVEDNNLRQNVASVLTGVCHWVIDPGLPEGAEPALLDGLKGNFGWEPLPQLHGLCTEGLIAILAAMVFRGELAQVQGHIQELQDLLEFLDDSREWRDKGIQRIHAHLHKEELVDRAIREAMETNQARLLAEIVPYLEFLGDAGAQGLVRNLGDEPDRVRRGRLMEVIRAMGPQALKPLGSALRSPNWFLVRNALNLLGELGSADSMPEVIACLHDQDGRVRRAAVRAAWKMGGPGAEPALMELLTTTDPETQMEVLFALGQIRSAASLPALSGFITDHRSQARLRHKAIEILGQLGHPGGIQVLSEMFRRKGFSIFSKAVEPSEIRVAAAKSLAAIGGPRALEILNQAIKLEGKGADRQAMESFLRTVRK